MPGQSLSMLSGKTFSSVSWYTGWGLLALIVLAVMVSHGLAVMVPFHFDDVHQIKLNSAFRDAANIPSFFTKPRIGSSTGHSTFYRPLLFITFLFDGLVGGGTPLPYRITSLFVLVLFALAARNFAMLFLQRITPSVSLETIKKIGSITGLLVVVHPIFNETVLLATSRSSTLMATFGLLGLAKLLQGGQTRWNNLYAVLFTLAALLTKETGVVLAPIAVLVSIVYDRDKRLTDRLWGSWPIVITILFYAIFHETVFQWMVKAEPGPPFPTSLANKTSPLVYPAQGGMALLGFIRLFFFPVGVSLVHEVGVPRGGAMLLGYSVWPASAALGIATIFYGGKLRMAGIALLWFIIALAPTLVLVRMNAPLAEHRAMIAVIMPLIVLSWAIYGIRPGRLRGSVAISLCVILGAASLVQTVPWRTGLEFWAHEVKAQPRSSRAWGFLADVLYEKGDLKGARGAIMNALRLSPKHPIYLARAAAIELAAGHPWLAGQYLKKGLAVEQNLPMLHLVEAERLAITGNLTEAYVHAETVTHLAPNLSAGWNAKGNVLYMQGKIADAVEAYRRALRMDPDNVEAQVNLKRALQRYPK